MTNLRYSVFLLLIWVAANDSPAGETEKSHRNLSEHQKSVAGRLHAESKSEIRIRPTNWAQPVLYKGLDNWYRVDEVLYRSEQPDDEDMVAFENLGIRTIVDLRSEHDDVKIARGTSLKLARVRMVPSKLKIDELIAGLRLISEADKPVLVHCHSGSDRTGALVAAYRILIHHWSVDDAIDEMVNGGYGFHSHYKNIIALLGGADWEELAKKLKEEPF